MQCHMAVRRSLRQQISLIIDSWKTATAYASCRYRCLKDELLKLSRLCAV